MLVRTIGIRAIVLRHLLGVVGILGARDREQRQGCHAREDFRTEGFHFNNCCLCSMSLLIMSLAAGLAPVGTDWSEAELVDPLFVSEEEGKSV